MRTAEEFKQAAQTHNITSWNIRDCSLCGYPLSYYFDGDNVSYDSGCDCISFSNIQPRSWEDVAEHYNRQTHPDYIKTMDAFWHFTSDTQNSNQ